MLKVKKELLMAISIPILFTVGIAGYVLLLPQESKTLDTFISYSSSLSAILMVLVVIVTTSFQLSAMKQQLSEMEKTRLLESQPLPYVRPKKGSFLEAPKFYYSPPESESSVVSRVNVLIEAENMGNGPAVSVDIAPVLRYFDESGKTLTVRDVNGRIESLKQGEVWKTNFMFTEDEYPEKPIVDSMIADFLSRTDASCIIGKNKPFPQVELSVLYKNVLGGAFLERLVFDLRFYDEDMDKIKSCLKLLNAARIDYAGELHQIEQLAKAERVEEVSKLIQKMNRRLSAREGCANIEIAMVPRSGSFMVRPISEEEYLKAIQDKGYGRVPFLTRTESTEPLSPFSKPPTGKLATGHPRSSRREERVSPSGQEVHTDEEGKSVGDGETLEGNRGLKKRRNIPLKEPNK